MLPEPNQWAAEHDGRDTHEGWHYEWRQADEDSWDLKWEVMSTDHAPRRCRYGQMATRCPNYAVARLWRGPRSPWAYCADHLFGRLLHDGHIWTLITVEDVPGTER